MLKSSNRLATVAYYLGQFHPIPENDRFWGDGFTEWHNVARARPLYPGHKQPMLPGKFGFYDLRSPGTLREQLRYAQEIGVNAFCFWHYWFAGKRLLHAPLDALLGMEEPGFRFMLGWANETWSGVWHGAPNKVIVQQTYGREELESHCKVLQQYISSGAYLTVDGKYPFVIYKPRQVRDSREYFKKMKELIKQSTGKELYLIGNWTPGRSGEFAVPPDHGMDAAVITPVAHYFKSAAARATYAGLWSGLRKCGVGPQLRSYSKVSATLQAGRRCVRGVSHATVVTGWDNSPRSGRRALVLTGYDESSFRRAARLAVDLELENGSPLLFVKSWNEWAEGNVIEPRFKETWSAGAVLKSVLEDHE